MAAQQAAIVEAFYRPEVSRTRADATKRRREALYDTYAAWFTKKDVVVFRPENLSPKATERRKK